MILYGKTIITRHQEQSFAFNENQEASRYQARRQKGPLCNKEAKVYVI
jgi:hypothetical protein